ncbi:NEP1-interacting protein-like 1 [Herrania umbratica]|uniref:RING-type E3 ubiquitin transferase n=1 Tax=Herrania umbratica TaxID=108875 RepID=A0A6J1BHA7_9ROSI|nr:NEP1-interacting protein-like 1 [Herrania umbratica]
MSDDFETCCHAWDVDWEAPEDESFPCATFSINIQARFTSVSVDDDDHEEEEDHEPCFTEPESVVFEKTEEVSVDRLMNENDNVSTVRDMLVSMDVPVHDFMVDKILACAHRMATAQRYRTRKVLRMRVEIEAVVDELPDHDDDDEVEEYESEESETAALVAEMLRKVVVDRPNSCCTICLEDFLVGSEATSMPCSHVFHHHCILPWLCKKKLCPLCRSWLF